MEYRFYGIQSVVEKVVELTQDGQEIDLSSIRSRGDSYSFNVVEKKNKTVKEKPPVEVVEEKSSIGFSKEKEAPELVEEAPTELVTETPEMGMEEKSPQPKRKRKKKTS